MLAGASPNWCSPKLTSIVPAEFWMGENSANDSARPVVMNRSNDLFCTEMRLGSSMAAGILLNVVRWRCACCVFVEDLAVGTGRFLLRYVVKAAVVAIY